MTLLEYVRAGGKWTYWLTHFGISKWWSILTLQPPSPWNYRMDHNEPCYDCGKFVHAENCYDFILKKVYCDKCWEKHRALAPHLFRYVTRIPRRT